MKLSDSGAYFVGSRWGRHKLIERVSPKKTWEGFWAGLAAGVLASVVFQLAHGVEEADFPLPRPDTGRMVSAWAEHQVQTTVDFAPRNQLLSWYVGGLNFQIEHHLFPQICHVHYPALAPVIQQVCREFGLRYTANPTFRASAASHFRWLRRMGRPDAAPANRTSAVLASEVDRAFA